MFYFYIYLKGHDQINKMFKGNEKGRIKILGKTNAINNINEQ